MNVAIRVVGIALLWVAAAAAPSRAQQAPVGAVATVQGSEQTDRAAIRDFVARPEVQRAARIGGVNLARIESGLDGLKGEELHRAAEQARALDSRLGEPGSADVITLQTTTLIIILLLVIIVILIA